MDHSQLWGPNSGQSPFTISHGLCIIVDFVAGGIEIFINIRNSSSRVLEMFHRCSWNLLLWKKMLLDEFSSHFPPSSPKLRFYSVFSSLWKTSFNSAHNILVSLAKKRKENHLGHLSKKRKETKGSSCCCSLSYPAFQRLAHSSRVGRPQFNSLLCLKGLESISSTTTAP